MALKNDLTNEKGLGRLHGANMKSCCSCGSNVCVGGSLNARKLGSQSIYLNRVESSRMGSCLADLSTESTLAAHHPSLPPLHSCLAQLRLPREQCEPCAGSPVSQDPSVLTFIPMSVLDCELIYHAVALDGLFPMHHL